jgi:hypothetical protein
MERRIKMYDTLYIIIEKTSKGFPAIWVGGGATARQFSAQFVLRDKKLAPAILTKSAGSWFNIEQALVPLQKGDVIVGVEGFLPANPDNPVIGVHGWKVKGFEINDDNCIAITESVDISINDVPSSVWEGCNILYNLDGRYFVSNE